jgi:hypothetical protein
MKNKIDEDSLLHCYYSNHIHYHAKCFLYEVDEKLKCDQCGEFVDE